MIDRIEITSLGNYDHSNSGAAPLKCYNLAVLLPKAISTFTKDCFGFLVQEKARIEKQGRIHVHQLRTGGQGRKCAVFHFSTRAH